MFDAHARHVFDYCYSLLGDRARATSATQVTLITAHSLAGRLKDAGRMRAFVLALGRRECLSGGQGLAGTLGLGATDPGRPDDFTAALVSVDQADEVRGADTGELALQDCEAPTGLSLRAMLQALPGEDREILDLLYRHGVSVADLAPLLGAPVTRVPGMLAAAESKFAARASETARPAAATPATASQPPDGPVSPDVRAEQLSAVPPASLPDSIWRRTARVVSDPGFPAYRETVCARAENLGPDGFPVQSAATPSNRKLLMTSALMAGLLLAPAAAGAVVYATVSTPAHVVEQHHNKAATPGGSVTRDPSAAGRAHYLPASHRSRRRSR